MKPEKELLERRAGLMYQLQDFEKNVQGRAASAEESAKWDQIFADVEALNVEIERGRKYRAQEALMAESQAASAETRGDRAPSDNAPAPNEGGKLAYRSVFEKWVRKGIGAMNSEERAMLHRGTNPQTTATDSLGGFTVPEEFGRELIKLMKSYGGMLENATVMRTSSGAAMPFPTVDDTAVTGALLAENAAMIVSDVTFGSVTLNAYMYTSQIIKLSYQLLQDEDVNLEGELMPILADRLGRIFNTHLTTGDGTGKPTGIVTSATAGATSVAVGAVTRNEIVDLLTSLDPAYQTNAKFMFNFNTLGALRKLTFGSGDARPLWSPSIVVGAPDLLEGKPYVINQDMADMGASAVPILYGDISKYRVRIARDVVMAEMNELYLANLQKGVAAFMRGDGALLDTRAVKKLTNAAV